MLSRGIVLDSEVSVDIEPSPTTLYDRSRFKNDGTFFAAGKPDWVRLPSGLWVMDFNGIDAEVTIPDSPELSFGDGSSDRPFSIMAWVKFDTVAYVKRLFSKVTVWAVDPEYIFQLVPASDLYCGCYDMHSDQRIVRTCSSLTTLVDTWYQIVMTYDGSGTIKIYRNASQIDDTSDDAGAYVAMHDTTSNLRIAEDLVADSDHWLDGSLVLVRIYNRALSAGKILQLFNAERHWFGV